MRLAGWRSCARWPLPTVAVGCVHQPAVQGGTAQPPQLADCLIAGEHGQARRLPLLYKPKRTWMSRVRMPVMTKVTTVPTMPAIWASRRCWKGHC